MASGSNNLTTYYAKRIIGDTNAQSSATALLQTGTGIATDLWILGNTVHDTYGIRYSYDGDNSHDKLQAWGGGNAATAWVQLDTGDVYILGKVGIGYDPNTSGNTYKLYVNGTSYFNDNVTIASGKRIGGSGGSLYIGNSGNESWVYVQDIASQTSTDNWKITQAGVGSFKNAHITDGLLYIKKTTTDWKTGARLEFNTTMSSTTGYSYIASYQTPTATTYNDSLVIVATGGCFIGGGEGAETIHQAVITGTGTEDLYLCPDGAIRIYTGADNKTQRAIFDSSSQFYPATNNTGAIGISGNKWANMYATTFHGALDGNATSASKVGADAATWMYFNNSNEVNFGGTNTSTTIYFGYRATDSRGKPDTYVFGTGNGTATVKAATFVGALTGNATTATTATYCPRLTRIADNTAATDTTAFSTDGLNVRWYTQTGKISGQPSQWGFLFTVSTGAGSSEVHQFWATQNNGSLYHRGTNGSTHASPPGFMTILDSSNYTSYTVTKTGSGASGTWGISVTGSAGSVAWANTGHPSTFPPSSHTHPVSQITWANGQNLSCTGGGEWSVDMSGDGYWHVWSGQLGRSVLQCYNYSGNVTIPGRLFISSDSDVTPNSSTGSLVIGNTSGLSIGIDANEIMCRSNNAVSTLYLNSEGGTVQIGGGITAKHGHDFMVGGNEFNFIPNNYNNTVWFNYTTYDRNNSGKISYYIFGNGRTGAMAYIGPNYFQAASGNLYLYASNGHFLAMQTDRNLVIYAANNGGSVWQSGTSTSTYRVKESITPIDKNEINNLFKLNVIRFNYKKEMNYYDTSRRYGMIAEEVLPLFPDIVDIPEEYDPGKFDLSKGIHQPLPGIRYERFIPLLIRCVQLQQERIEKLEKQIKCD